MPVKDLQKIVTASLMAALIAVGAYLHVPIGITPIPIVLQNFFVLLAGLLLGSRWGLTSVCIYLLVGAIGMPVFTGGKGGLAHFMGPTGGYLIGYLLCVFVVGFITERARGKVTADVIAVITGSLLVYVIGVPWLKAVTGMPWDRAVLAGMAPFLPGDAIKCCAAVILAKTVRPILSRQMETASS